MMRVALLLILQNKLFIETTSTSQPEPDLSIEKQQTYLAFESALLLLFSICFSFLLKSLQGIHFYSSNKFAVIVGESALCRENSSC